MNKIKKEIWPITYFSASVILRVIAYQEGWQSIISIFLIFTYAILMEKNLIKLNGHNYRLKCSIAELIFCVIVFSLANFLVLKIGNVLTFFLCLATFSVYVFLICPNILERSFISS